MVRDQARVQIRAVVDRVAVLRALTRRQIIAVLPEHIAASAIVRIRQRGGLPRALDRAVVGGAKLLEQTRLAQRLTRCAVVDDPVRTPSLSRRDAPALGVEVICAEVDLGNGAVCGEVVATGA